MMETQNYWEDNSTHSMQVKYERWVFFWRIEVNASTYFVSNALFLTLLQLLFIPLYLPLLVPYDMYAYIVISYLRIVSTCRKYKICFFFISMRISRDFVLRFVIFFVRDTLKKKQTNKFLTKLLYSHSFYDEWVLMYYIYIYIYIRTYIHTHNSKMSPVCFRMY